MKSRTFQRKLVTALLALSLTLGMPKMLPLRMAQADWDGDIDSVMQELDSDFQFGNKEEIKQSQLGSVNEQLREDVQIKENEEQNQAETEEQNQAATEVNISFTITELGAPAGNNLKVTFPATIGMGVSGPVLINGLDGAAVTKNINIPLGVTLQLVAQCLSPSACDFIITINSGGTFTSLGASTGSQMLAASSGMAVFSVVGL